MKPPMASANAPREPKREAAQALSSMPTVIAARNPVASQWTWSWATLKRVMIAGTATLMMVAASTTEKVPSMTVTDTYHL